MKNTFYNTTFIVSLALLVNSLSYSQKAANNWSLGNFGLEFKPDTVIVHNNYSPHESRGMGIISDDNGQLLCYTDGLSIWNRNHTVMPNGLNMSTTLSGTKVQSSVIIPKPNSSLIYYTFTVHSYNGQSASGLYYSIVDLTKDNGLGDVILKGKKIQEHTDNKITAVYHNNGHDVWIITHQHNSNSYYAYLLTVAGLTETPVISTVGKSFSSSIQGQLKASPDGSKIACSYSVSSTSEGFSLFNFDNSTGKLTNPLSFSMPVSYRGCGGLEFSPDAKKLYVYQSGSTGESALYQFDISTVSSDYINNSRTKLFQDAYNSLLEMQLATNGKIYFTKGGGQESGSKYLGVVENPNDLGSDCIVKELGLYLDNASAFVARTPTFVQNYFFKTDFTFNNACSGNLTDFQITNETSLDSVKWNFGEGSTSVSRHPRFNYSLPGKYSVTLFAYYPTKTDTIQKQVTINPSPVLDLGNDTTVCYGHEFLIAEGFKSYRWNTGDNTRSIVITKSGNYKLTVENQFGCQTTDSVYLNLAAIPVVDLPDSIQLGALYSIPVSAGNFKSYLWNTGETSSSIQIKDEGWYSVTVENETGCSATKSFYVYVKQAAENQSDWKLLNPLPSALPGLDICFLNRQVGYIMNNNEILVTTDSGTTWAVLMRISSGIRMAFKNNYGYIIAHSGVIYKSTYMGLGWNKLTTGISDNFTGLSVISKDTVFVTGDKKLYSTFDGGLNWNTSNITSFSITSSFFTSSNVGHVGCSNGNVYKTIDGGKTWTLKSSTSSSSRNINRMYFADDNTGFISRGYGGGILKTTDAGEIWKSIVGTSDDINSFFFLDSQNGFIAGGHGVIFKTTNGGATWEWIGFQNARYDGTDINALYFIDTMTGFATGLGGRILKTIDGGKTWNQYAPIYSAIRQLNFTSNATVYGLAGNSFLKSTDGCTTWENIGPPVLNANTRQFDFVNEDIGYCIAGGDIGTSASVAKVFKTTDGGKTWIATYGGNEIMNDNLYSIDFVDDKIGFVSGGFNDRHTFKTTNGGANWTKVNDFSFGQMQFLNSSVGYARNVGNLYNRIYKTIDGGQNWTITFEIDEDINSFHFLDVNNGYFVGDNSLMYKTTDGGTTWKKLTAPYKSYINVKFYSPNVGFITESYGQIFQTNNGGLSWGQVAKPYNVNGLELYGDNIYAFGVNGVILKKNIDFKPVVLIVNAASSITSNSVTISGNATSNKQIIKDIKFEYGIGNLINQVAVDHDSVQVNESLSLSLNLNDLKPNQTYNYRLSATAGGIHYYSDILQFRTLPNYTIIFDNVYNVGSSDVSLFASVVTNTSDITDIEFQYGPDTSFPYKVTAQPAVITSGMSPIVSASINQLKPMTKYYARVKATYNGLPVYSASRIFTTANTFELNIYSPYVTGNNARFDIYIKANKDTIKNMVMEYGTTRDYKHKVEIAGQIPKGTASFLSAQLNALDSAIVYFYRFKANMGNEIIYSAENLLKLKRDVIMIPVEYTQLSDSSVLLKGLVNANGTFLGNVKFHYGLTESLGDSVLAVPNYTTSFSTSMVSSTLYRLTPGHKYFAKLSATNGTSMFYSEPFTFELINTGLDSLIDDFGVLMYPNPALKIIYLKSDNEIVKLEILDSFGKILSTTNNVNKIDISQLQKGIYFFRIYLRDNVVTKKMLKN
jgi:photosystem II stability/assembly factor-like uncharacterized protein